MAAYWPLCVECILTTINFQQCDLRYLEAAPIPITYFITSISILSSRFLFLQIAAVEDLSRQILSTTIETFAFSSGTTCLPVLIRSVYPGCPAFNAALPVPFTFLTFFSALLYQAISVSAS
jgi:hypothetical protein